MSVPFLFYYILSHFVTKVNESTHAGAFNSVSINCRHAGDLRKRKLYFVNLNSSAYEGTVEFKLAKSKQQSQILDEFGSVYRLTFILGFCTKNYLLILLLAVERLFRQSDESTHAGAFVLV